MRSIVRGMLLLCSAVALTACEVDRVVPVSWDRPGVSVVISVVPSLIEIGTSATVTVVATNSTDETVYYGFGSSSCSLFGQVQVDGESYYMQASHVCTDDAVRWTLAAGEVQAESWRWDGTCWRYIQTGDEYVRETLDLTPGTYEIRGKAGPYIGPSATVTFVE